jgi:phosphoglycerate dehydrogenase-like enzyme
MTNSSGVYAEPCAEHAFSMMLALARQLPQCVNEQTGDRGWRQAQHRENCRLLVGQSVLVFGLGAIGSRLVEMLEPLKMNVIAVRRRPAGNERCAVITLEQADAHLPAADHVMNILPASGATEGFFTRRRLGLLKPTAIFYNIGRGTTVDQSALAEALQNRKIGGAYLDVTDPEPLPAAHALWSAPNCYISPHTAGGHVEEFERLVRHFADNLDRFTAGNELKDRIV